ncbi:MAG: NADH:ubiquinone oxidoreductase subunit NDUFA12 [Alphaproteobacteria bacterium]|nr:NADH:ubiquinone oxidoreductase subunit NDUFA12 [Alphaproteobacteria bacterium]
MDIGTHLYTLFRGLLVGTDSQGNRYYKAKSWKPAAGSLRREKRWVIFKGDKDSSRVPAEWHAWLHATSDSPLTPDPAKGWQREHQANKTGSAHAYLPPGHDLMGGKREKASGDYQPWRPN